MRRHGVAFLLVVSVALVSSACSESAPPPVAPVDSGAVLGDSAETRDTTPEFDADEPLGRVLLLPLYDPSSRCLLPPTEIGQLELGDDGKPAPCAKVEVCYERPDGVLAYHGEDCVHGTNFSANWTRHDYSDLGPCEPLKRMRDKLADCPKSSCVFARDVLIDTARGCATAITSRGCRATFGPPTGCFCDGTGRVFVAADPGSPATPPPSFTPCDATDTACKQALDSVDTVKGCDG